MWIAHTEGWISIVSHRDDPEVLLVRARRDDHITHLWPDAEIIILADADYRYRAAISREMVAEVIAEVLINMEYDDFKSHVSDVELRTSFLSIWDFMRERLDE
jgi:hypothetical protein